MMMMMKKTSIKRGGWELGYSEPSMSLLASFVLPSSTLKEYLNDISNLSFDIHTQSESFKRFTEERVRNKNG